MRSPCVWREYGKVQRRGSPFSMGEPRYSGIAQDQTTLRELHSNWLAGSRTLNPASLDHGAEDVQIGQIHCSHPEMITIIIIHFT